MSTASRLISGSAASWIRIGITMVSQIVLVPIYINFWGVEIFGIWLAVQSLIAIVTITDLGHQTFLAFEFLRIGKNNLKEMSLTLWSGISVGLCIATLQIILILAVMFTGTLPSLLGDSGLKNEAAIEAGGIILLLQGIAWLIATSMGGLFARVLEACGYYPRMAWWGVWFSLLTNLAPAVAVAFGADLLTAGIVIAITHVVSNIPQFLDMFRLMRKEQIKFTIPSVSLAYKNFVLSMAVAGKLLLENTRQTGVRIVLAPLAGAAGLAAFSTMRTGSNVAMQGLSTITNPLMPDLMKFLHARDQTYTEAAFGTVWIVVVALMAPSVVILQAFVEPLFELWTQGQVQFDAPLFAILSLSVLVYAVIQPALAVVFGNNLVSQQLWLSIMAAVAVILSIIVLVPLIGIIGAAFALLIGEIIAFIGYRFFAIRWLKQNALVWPNRLFLTAVASVGIAGIAMFSMIFFSSLKWLIVGISLLLFCWNFWRFWNVLPTLVTDKLKLILSRVPIIKSLLSTYNS